MQNGFKHSKLELRRSRTYLRVGSKLHPSRPRPGGSASFRALSPMVTTTWAGGGRKATATAGPVFDRMVT
eukprot:6027933-Alexandrium_andersonii.AAC.1